MKIRVATRAVLAVSLALSLALSLACSLAAQSSVGRVTTIQLAKTLKVEQVLYEDLSGDGAPDLVIAVSTKGREYQRFLHVHYAKTSSGRPEFAQKPDTVATVPRSVSAYAIGDVHADAGGEVIWFGARGVYAWRPGSAEKDREVKLVSSEFLYQYPHPVDLLSWQPGVVDLDADGLVDLLLPEPTGYRVAMQRRNATGAVRFQSWALKAPPAPPKKQSSQPQGVRGSRSGDRLEIGLSIGSSIGAGIAPLVSVEESVPAPQIADWDGDGDLDIVAKRGDRVLVWLQNPAGTYAATPAVDLQFPLSEEQTRLDPRFAAFLIDYNRDRLADVILIAKDRFAKEIRTQVLFFPQKPGGDTPLFAGGTPGQVLVLAGFSTLPRLTDIDGDGSPDLQIGSWRVDVLDQITAGDERSIDVEMYVFLNKNGQFSRRPNLTHKSSVDGDSLSRGATRLFGRFIGDVTGDGIGELLIRDRPERIQLLMVRRQGESLTVIPRPLFQLSVAESAEVRHLPLDAKRNGFLVLEENQVLLVNFR